MNEFCLTTHRALLRRTALALAMSLALSGAAFAQDASQLGKALTPIGAEKASGDRARRQRSARRRVDAENRRR